MTSFVVDKRLLNNRNFSFAVKIPHEKNIITAMILRWTLMHAIHMSCCMLHVK